jgi:hypothetical protein
MAQENFVCNHLLHVVEESVVVVDVLGGVVSNVVFLGSWIRLRNSGRVGNLLVGCVNSQNETVLSAEFWVDIIAFSSSFKSFLSFFSSEKFCFFWCVLGNNRK